MSADKGKNGIWLVLGATFILGACTPTASQGLPSVTDVPRSAPLESETAAPVDPASPETALPRLPRQALEASDPSTVVLAAGQPQLVEFFAYW